MGSSTKTPATEARTRLLAAGVVAGLAVLVYQGTFDVPFTFDDDLHLVEGSAGRDVSGALRGCATNNRCVGFLTFALNYTLGGLELRGYHAGNLLVHLGASLLVLLLGLLLVETPRLAGSVSAARARWVAFGAAVVFAVHPVQTMAVTYVVQRFASLAALLYLASVTSWLAGRLSGRAGLLGLSLFAGALAMKTKENTVTLPVMLLLLELALFEGAVRRRLLRLLPWALLVALPAMTTLTSPGSLDAALRANTEQPRLGYLATQLTVVPRYLQLLAWPAGQSVDHHPRLYEAPWQPTPLAGGLLLVGLLAAAGWATWRTGPRRAALRLPGLGGLWFFVALSLESSVVPIRDVMVEHRLYLPSVGLCLSLAMGGALVLDWLRARSRSGAAIAAGLMSLVPVALAAATLARNEVWRDEPRLWREASALAPHAWRPKGNTGQALLERGRCAEALPWLEEARKSDPTVLEPVLNLGVCSVRLGERALGRRYFEEALGLDHNDGRAPAQLAQLASEDGDLLGARALYERALGLTPTASEVRAGLGATLGQLGLLREARVELERAVAELPGSAMAWGNLGNVRALQEDLAGAEQAWRRALECDPTDAAARQNLARLLEQRVERPAGPR